MSCRAGRHCFSERCFCTKNCDFHWYHVRTSLKRVYGAPRMFCAKVERKLSIPSKPIRFLKNWQFFQKICHAIWKCVFRPFRCSKSALRLSTIWGKGHAVLHISDSDSICLLNMCCVDTVGTVFRSVAFAQKFAIFSNITFERPWNVCTGLPACFVPKSNGNCRFHQNPSDF